MYQPGSTPFSPTIDDDGVKEFHLHAQPIRQTLFDNADYENMYRAVPQENIDHSTTDIPDSDIESSVAHVWGYNGQHPGPMIEVRIGVAGCECMVFSCSHVCMLVYVGVCCVCCSCVFVCVSSCDTRCSLCSFVVSNISLPDGSDPLFTVVFR